MRIADTQWSMADFAMSWNQRGDFVGPQSGLAVDTPLQEKKWLPGGTCRGATHGVSREARRRGGHRICRDDTLLSRQMLD